MNQYRIRLVLTSLAIIIVIAGVIVFLISLNGGGAISLEWNSNSEADLAGYKVYYGTSSGDYTHSVVVLSDDKPRPAVVHYKLSGLVKEQKYFLSVTAFNKQGQESTFSNEAEGTAR